MIAYRTRNPVVWKYRRWKAIWGIIPSVNWGGLSIREKIPSISGMQELTTMIAMHHGAKLRSRNRHMKRARARLYTTCSIYILYNFVLTFQIFADRNTLGTPVY